MVEKSYIFLSNEDDFKTNKNKSFFDFDLANNLSVKIEEKLLGAWGYQSEERKKEFLKWAESKTWLEDYSLFMVIKEEFNKSPWWEWPCDFKQKNNEFLEKWKKKKQNEILKKKLVQWHLNVQWIQIKGFAKINGIKLIGDLPFYVSRDSADVWSNRSLFSISHNGDLLFQSGVPPDYFSSTGQLWGTPTYFWSKHERTNFNWWRKRFQDNSNL